MYFRKLIFKVLFFLNNVLSFFLFIFLHKLNIKHKKVKAKKILKKIDGFNIGFNRGGIPKLFDFRLKFSSILIELI